VLPFWLNHSFDELHGGFLSCVGRSGELYGTDKYTWLNGRAVWMTAEVCRVKSDQDLQRLSKGRLSHSKLLECSTKTADFLLKHAVSPFHRACVFFFLRGFLLPFACRTSR
jgi:N-acylglucosamine 2-epimerase